ncbi:amino acid ABC transporter permease [Aeropyrum camini]|uniref:ABC transporter permease n=1 Tax=Aeropyrum camini SY1 = JCM 12091 TaxID=1198449 RepID=U3TH66_9CREN|nr:amino acid ABC transporter permease [Aeropyrum camini]BAN90659.1 ABC transporter permease [Aeropyrum camini SY1 = JCM 12091]
MLDLAVEYQDYILRGVVYTIAITLISLSMGFTISLVLTAARFLGFKPLRLAAEAYINFFRGTPLLVQILMVFFGLPSIGINLSAFHSAVIAIGLNSGAYQAEILRVAIKGIPEEQMLVARSLGLSEIEIMKGVVIPQAVRNAIPGLTNEAVILLKESSLASVIGVMELTRVGEYMVSATFRALEAYLLIALIYLSLSMIAFRLLKRAEKSLAIPGFERWV